MISKTLIEFESATFRLFTKEVFKETDLTIRAGEHTAIVGRNASGKTTLAKALIARVPSMKGQAYFHLPYDKIVFVNFQSSLKLANNTDDAYLQQRWQSFDTETAPLVKDFFWSNQEIDEYTLQLLKQFSALPLLEKRNIQLSNGELRKIELIKALSKRPELIIIDNAFVGLDVASREILRQVLIGISQDCTLIVTTLLEEEVPTFITGRIYCEDMEVVDELASLEVETANLPPNLIRPNSPNLPSLVELRDVNIAYGKYEILKAIKWNILAAEHWALVGPNGSGKSTLLSLLVADNPQAYAEEIYLFGKKRGKGETIWDIKRSMGFISPELHQFTPKMRLIRQVLISDIIWLYPGIDRAKVKANIQIWLDFFDLKLDLEARFGSISSGEQRLILFIRTLLYPFDLLIADEPCQGLDAINIEKVRAVFTYLAKHTTTSSIFVTHQRSELPETTDKMFDLKKENKVFEESGIGTEV